MSLSNQVQSEPLKVVTVDSEQAYILRQQTIEFSEDEMVLALEIDQKLRAALAPHLPAAGLAAPQIGIERPIFIYSYDRDPKNLETVINPSFQPIGNEKIEGWEGCLSVILSDGVWKLAKIARYAQIQVNYLNLNGDRIQKILDGFAAKVFQHEYDHLQGIVNIDREDAIVKEFSSKEELSNFMQDVKKEDAANYKTLLNHDSHPPFSKRCPIILADGPHGFLHRTR
ncbi:MAG: peptide deformylase [Chlamydiales bacterium]